MKRILLVALLLLCITPTAGARSTHVTFDVKVRRADGIVEDVYISIPREWARNTIGCAPGSCSFGREEFSGNAPLPPSDQEPSFAVTHVERVRRTD